MPAKPLNIHDFLELRSRAPILDVRSPGEYAHAHLPGAVSFPVFNDEDRKVIGTAYKQESRETAIKIGLASFGRNMVGMVEAVEKLLSQRHTGSREIGVHCWRGGMRSSAVAWLLDFYGYEVFLLTGGYKAYRHWVAQQFDLPRQFYLLGGYTGSNKTGVITELRRQHEKAIDLEGLAGHKGSAFGNLDRDAQPTQEMFENLLATELARLDAQGPSPIWLEDESQRIGSINLPPQFFSSMRQQPFVFIDIPFEQRLQHLLSHYEKFDKEKFINAILRIKKRLGGIEARQAVNFIMEDDMKGCFAVLLRYYDKAYLKSLLNRDEEAGGRSSLAFAGTDAHAITKQLIYHASNR